MDPKAQLRAIGILWALSLVASFLFYGVLGGTVNVFFWWASFITAIEFLVFIPMNIGALPALFATPVGQEQTFIFMGVPAFAAWMWTLLLIARSDDKRKMILETVLTLLFIPPLGLIATYRLFGKYSEGKKMNSPGEKDTADVSV